MRIWDIYVRLYHWLQLTLIAGCWWTAENSEMEWHMSVASVLIALWISRLFWGVAGSDTARFCRFVKGPGQTIAFAKAMLAGDAKPVVGHNPLGAWMIMALLLVIGIQGVTGLFSSDEIFTDGPLVAYASSETVELMTQIHELNFNVLLALAAVHVLAVVVYSFKGEKLVPAMFAGKRTDLAASDQAPALKPVWPAVALFLLLAGALYSWIML